MSGFKEDYNLLMRSQIVNWTDYDHDHYWVHLIDGDDCAKPRIIPKRTFDRYNRDALKKEGAVNTL